MNYNNCSTLSCRFCQHYEVEGRRGGLCHLLNVSVRGTWQACPWAIRSFIPEPILVENRSQVSNLSVNYDKIIPLINPDFTDSPSRKKVS